MADPTGIAPYLVANNSENALVPNARTFVTAEGSGLATSDSGPDNNFTLTTIEALNAINNLSGNGYLVSSGTSSPYFYIRDFTSTDGTIAIAHPDGQTGSPDFSVVPGMTAQMINFFYNTGTSVGTAANLNLVPGGTIDITPQYDAETNTVSYVFSGGGGGGGGGITEIVSSLATLDITDPTGPIVTIDIAATNSPSVGDFLKCTAIGPNLFTWSLGASGITEIDSSTGLLITNTGNDYHVNFPASQANGSVLFATNGTTTAWTPAPTGNPQVLTWNGSTVAWASGGGGGGLTSVGLSSSSGLLTGNTPLTANGTITVDLPGAATQGNILYSNGKEYTTLGIGSPNQVLTVAGGNPTWANPTGGVGSGGIATLTGTGTNISFVTIPYPSVSSTTTIVATGWGDATGGGSIPATPAGGPLTIQIDPGVSFTIIGDNTDTGKGVAYQINGGGGGGLTSVGLASASGTPISYSNNPLTANGNITLTLGTVTTANGGTGLTSYTAGDLPYFASGTALSKLGIQPLNSVLISSGTAPEWLTAPTGSSPLVLTYSGSGTISWAAGGGGGGVSSLTSANTGLLLSASTGAITITNQWWNSVAGSGVNMNQFNIVDINSLSFYAGSGIPSAVTNGFAIGNNGTGLPQINSAALSGTHNLVTSVSTSYGAIGSVLLGNGIDYTPLIIGANTYVLTSNGTTASWQAGGGGGGAIYGKGTFSGNSSTVDPIIPISDTSVTSNCIVVVSGTDMTGTNPSAGPYHVVITAGTGFVIHGKTTPGSDGGSNCTYSYTP